MIYPHSKIKYYATVKRNEEDLCTLINRGLQHILSENMQSGIQCLLKELCVTLKKERNTGKDKPKSGRERKQ